MNPIQAADASVSIVERHGVLGAVIICSSVLVVVLSASTVALWRALVSSRKETQDSRRELSLWLFSEASRQHQFSREIESHLSIVRAARELAEEERNQHASKK